MLCPPAAVWEPPWSGTGPSWEQGRWPRGSGCQSGRELHHDLCCKEWIGMYGGRALPTLSWVVLFEVSRMFPRPGRIFHPFP